MGAKVKVKFQKSYIASRGAGISGNEGDEREFPMSDQLQALIDKGTVVICREAPAKRRTKAKKKDADE